MEQSLENSTVHQFEFTGGAGEYFKIWLANLALTIVTLGIYGPWAKVRREQYFHSHTLLNSHPFEYTADPLKILKGRIIVFSVFILLAVAGNFHPLFNAAFSILLLLLSPWLITQAFRFRTRYTSYRNLTFGFDGTYWKSAVNFIILRILGVFSLGVFFPWANFRERKYVLNSLRYGRTYFNFNGRVGAFYRAYLVAAIVFVPLAVIFILRMLMATFFTPPEPGFVPDDNFSYFLNLVEGKVGGLLLVVFAVLGVSFVIPVVRVLLSRYTWSNATLDKFTFSYTLGFGRFIWIYLSNFILRLVTLGLATPYCVVRLYRYKVSQLSAVGPANFDEFVGARQAELRALGDEAADAYDFDVDIGL